MYTKRGDTHRDKAGKCEVALAELEKSRDLKKVVALAMGDRFTKETEAMVDQMIAAAPGVRAQEATQHWVEQARVTLAAALKRHKVESDHCDWLAAHVDKAPHAAPTAITEEEARHLRGLDDYGYQMVPAIPAFAGMQARRKSLGSLYPSGMRDLDIIDEGAGLDQILASVV